MNLIWKYLTFLFIVLAAIFGSYRYGRHVEHLTMQVKQDEAVQAEQQKGIDALTVYIQHDKEADIQHDNDQKLIAGLHDKLNSMLGTIPITGTNLPQTGTNSNGGNGVLSNSVDAAFRQLQEGVNSLVERCDQLNSDAQRMNNELK